jgi:putative transposase
MVEDVEFATLTWVHRWNTSRLHAAIGDIPPAEHAARYAQQSLAQTAGQH